MDAVARIQSFANMGTRVDLYGYAPGRFYSLAPKATFYGPRYSVPGVVIRRAGNLFGAVIKLNMLLEVGDVVFLSPSTLCTIEFLIGGRVSVMPGRSVEIVNERSVIDSTFSQTAKIATRNARWSKQGRYLKQPLEIQTNGGTMGIHG